MSASTIGFIGLGRLGLPLAARLLESGHEVVSTSRGRAAEFVELGGTVAGDGSPRAVADVAGVVFSCLPTVASMEEIVAGAQGLVTTDGPAPTLVELSTFPIDAKNPLRDLLVARGGEMLDAPVSGTPPMAQAGKAVAFSSGDRAVYDRLAALIATISPAGTYVGDFGTGTKLKYIANTLAFTHVTVAAEAMAFAERMGLDLATVAEIISGSGGASSGQFAIRAPMMASGNFPNALVTVDMTLKDLKQITATAEAVGASVPILTTVAQQFADFAAAGEGDSEPGKLFEHYLGRTSV